MRPRSRGKWRHGESNSRHSACKADALPTELCPLKTPVYLAASLPWDSEKARRSWLFQVGPDGLEPSTFALSERRSNQLSYEPWHTLADQGWRIVGEHAPLGKGEFRFSRRRRFPIRALSSRTPPRPTHRARASAFPLHQVGCRSRAPRIACTTPAHRRTDLTRPFTPSGVGRTGLGVTGHELPGTKIAHLTGELVVSFVKPETRLANQSTTPGKEGDLE